jgi:hypothetical protein
MENLLKVVLYYLWIAPHVLLAVLSVLIFVRRLHKQFPIFFVYCLYETLVFFLLFYIRAVLPAQKNLYRDVFIATLAGSTALRFGIIQEIFNNIFRDYPRVEVIATSSTRWVTGLLLIGAVVIAGYSSENIPDNLMAGIALLDRSVIVIQAGLLIFLFLFSRLFGLSWRSYTLGIALGFGIFASTELAYWALRLIDLSEHAKDLLDLLPTGSYHVSVLVWLGYLAVAEKPVGIPTCSVPEIDRWSGELERTR